MLSCSSRLHLPRRLLRHHCHCHCRPRHCLYCCAAAAALLLSQTAGTLGRAMATTNKQSQALAADGSYYRHDGVRITHDPYAPGMASKYGAPGKTDSEGFDPYADSVGAGIYSGVVQRDSRGTVVIGRQYQSHNPQPGPVYAGGGYTPVSLAIGRFEAEGAAEGSTSLGKLLSLHPDLVNDVSTGGALPLHTCGMSGSNQYATAFLVSKGADIEAVDTYGFTPLHRMASNNLAFGAKTLLDAGADPLGLKKAKVASVKGTPTPLQVAQESRARDVIAVLKAHGNARRSVPETAVSVVEVLSAGYAAVVGKYTAVDGRTSIPVGFEKVCIDSGWNTQDMWSKLNGGEDLVWFKHESNDSYLYFNNMDRHWWIDGPNGLGAYKASGPPWAPPGASTAWENLLSGKDATAAGPVLAVHRGATACGSS